MPSTNPAPPVRAKGSKKTTQKAAATRKPATTAPFQVEAEQVTFTRGDRSYRVRGLQQNSSSMRLNVNILARRLDLVHLDTLDLVKARARNAFIKATANELYLEENVVKKDIGQLLLQLEELQHQQLAAMTETQATHELTSQQTEEALQLLRDPQLLQRIVADMQQCGTVGEDTNKLIGYLASVSRLLPWPLAVLIQSSSSAGKTSLMDSILAMMPPEQQLKLSGLTGQSLFYLDSDMRHKILAIAEDEGLGQAAYGLKLLQSEGELRHACVGKTKQGRMGTQHYHVQGPVQILLTTTSSQIDEELLNRCLVLAVDESRQQTAAIQDLQRQAETREGSLALRVAEQTRTLHQNAQRLLRPLEVYNPHAPSLTFTSDKTRLRRDHAKYLTLIKAVALLHQYQRQVHVEEVDGQAIEYINVTPEDIATANRLASEALGRTLDELSPQTRRCLLLTHELVSELAEQQTIDRCDVRFTRRQLREASGWSDFQLRTHLRTLVELEYVLVHRGRRGRQFVYELLYDGQGQQGTPFLMGLIDPETLGDNAS